MFDILKKNEFCKSWEIRERSPTLGLCLSVSNNFKGSMCSTIDSIAAFEQFGVLYTYAQHR